MEYNFYSVIIGSELLNGRRKDKHFEFLNNELIKRGWGQVASFVIKDDPKLIIDTFNLIKKDNKSVMFCFGGIGATPDDYTRECAATAFTNSKMEENKEAKKMIIDRFGSEAYPNRIKMANLPINAKLLHNPITNVPGFYLEDRFFFVPGFPEMAKPMVLEALDKLYPKNPNKKYFKVATIYASENELIPIMKTISSEVDFSSLPIIEGNNRFAVISIVGNNEDLVESEFSKFINFCKKNNISFELKDIKAKK